MRLAGGAWCIAALILTNYYSSVLTSLITASSPVPIANSVEEMANNEDIELVIVKGRAIAVMIAVCHPHFMSQFKKYILLLLDETAVSCDLI